ncbi:MAG: cyclopropane-fatty-acyl-phospholipid synthase [Methylophilaceae bacterium]|jgi:cyclopropane-fatty-acyl-phospholipid synthase|nr:cyclopropane-fatty-acyl-phospholipid synthase [Methylophilaceae bacterium]
MITILIKIAEKNLLPDTLIRYGIRSLLKKRLHSLSKGTSEERQKIKQNFINAMDESPIALVPELANEQHYEVPAEFYNLCLGLNKKYSSCYWDKKTNNLDQAEKLALKKTCNHANLKDGLSILELGCGWGSLTLWMAKHYPKSSITAVSNSSSQRTYILSQAKLRKLKNIEVITCDMNIFKTNKKYDRIVSVEMIEHMRNHRKLFANISRWLNPKGKFFMHIFVHKSQPYLFEVEDKDDWMSQYFFSGGMMPSEDLPLHFQDKIKIEKQWTWSGNHYENTANAWLKNIDKNNIKAIQSLESVYGKNDAKKWLQRWRIFFMACAELWGFNDGDEWRVSHYLFKK